MDNIDDIRKLLEKSDIESLEMRAQRQAEIIDINYEGVYTPTLEYLHELDKLYVDGHFMATIIFAGTIIEYILKGKLYLVADVDRLEKAGLGTLCEIAKRKKILPKIEIERLLVVKSMRNILVHSDSGSEFAQELMDCIDIDDPVTQRIWFFNGSQFSLMAKTCANIARGFALNDRDNQ